MLCSVTFLALFAAAQAAVSGDYCYTDSKICTALAESGYTFPINKETVGQRSLTTIPKVVKAYRTIVAKMCEEAPDKASCLECYQRETKNTFEDEKECGKNVDPRFTKTKEYMETGYLNDNVTLTLDASRISCYMNQKAQLVFGQLQAKRTFVKPKGLDQNMFRTWVQRAMIVVDYVDVSLEETDTQACKFAGDSEILERASIMEFFGLTPQELKEEVVCRCLSSQK